MKQLLISAFAVAVLLLFGGVNEVNGDPLTYEVVGDTVTIKDCKETASGALVIPATYDGKPVTSIGSWAFWKCTSLTSVTIPDNVTSIGNFTFHSCSDLTSVTIGNSVLNIMAGAFFRCSSLTSVTIPDSVTNIDIGAFVGCSSLTSIEVGKNNAEYSSEDEVLFSKNKTELIRFPAGKNGHYTIPDNVTSIADTAFYHCSRLTRVTIPDSVTSIGYRAFKNCVSLTSVTIPDSVISIHDSAFEGCTSLKRITFGGDAPFFLGANVFRNVSGNARVFINPDAIAFGETFEGLPVIIQEKIEINTFSKSAAPFSLNFESKSGSTYIIEATQNLRQRVTWQWRWRKIGEVKGTGSSVTFTDWREALFQKQYYRVKLVE